MYSLPVLRSHKGWEHSGGTVMQILPSPRPLPAMAPPQEQTHVAVQGVDSALHGQGTGLRAKAFGYISPGPQGASALSRSLLPALCTAPRMGSRRWSWALVSASVALLVMWPAGKAEAPCPLRAIFLDLHLGISPAEMTGTSHCPQHCGPRSCSSLASGSYGLHASYVCQQPKDLALMKVPGRG